MKKIIDNIKDRRLDRMVRFYLPIILALIAGGIVDDVFSLFDDPDYERVEYVGDTEETDVTENNLEPKILTNFKIMGKIYVVLNKLLEQSGVEKIILLKAHNHGGPVPDKSTIIAETYNENYNIYEEWQSQPLDEGYVNLLYKLTFENKIIIDVEDLKPGLLKNLYIANDIKESDIRLVGGNDESLFFLSIHLNDDFILTPYYEYDVSATTTKIRNMLKEINAIE